MRENKIQKIYKTIMLILVVAIVAFVVTSILNYEGSLQYKITGKEEEKNVTQKIQAAALTITELLNDKYLGEIDEEALVEGAMRGMVESVGDAYTEYYTKEELEDFTTETLGNFVGIGVYMQADMDKDTITVIAPIQGSPAEKAGLQTGDIILKADGVKYSAEQIEELSDYIKGEKGTTVELTISRNDEILNIKVTRDEVHINYVTSEMLQENIGYISIATFDQGCKDDFLEAYNQLAQEGAKSLIIDLRGNGGGLVDEALEIADLMCDKGDVLLITADKNENKEITKAKSNPTITLPIVVLTDRGSASASEILAAALKDNEKAEIVGEKTFGKGVIQELVYLSNGGALKVTSAEYYTPKEEKINDVGIEPNHKVTDINAQLDKAITLLREKMK